MLLAPTGDCVGARGGPRALGGFVRTRRGLALCWARALSLLGWDVQVRRSCQKDGGDLRSTGPLSRQVQPLSAGVNSSWLKILDYGKGLFKRHSAAVQSICGPFF